MAPPEMRGGGDQCGCVYSGRRLFLAWIDLRMFFCNGRRPLAAVLGAVDRSAVVAGEGGAA